MKISFTNKTLLTLNGQTFHNKTYGVLTKKHKTVKPVTFSSSINERECVPLYVFSNCGGTYVDIESSIDEFFIDTVLENSDVSYVIHDDIFSDYDDDVAQMFIDNINLHACTNVILPIEWFGYYDYNIVCRVSFYNNNPHLHLNRSIEVVSSSSDIISTVRSVTNSVNGNIEVTVVGVAAPEFETGSIIV